MRRLSLSIGSPRRWSSPDRPKGCTAAGLLLPLACLLLALGAQPASASTSGSWTIGSLPSPTSFAPGSGAQNQVDLLAIHATGGTFTLTPGSCGATAPIAFNATASAVQSALEALSCVGAGNISVAGGPGATNPFTITFTGSLGGQPQNLLDDGSSLTGGSASATVGSLIQGSAASPTTLVLTATNTSGATTDGTPITITDTVPSGLSVTPGDAGAITGTEAVGRQPMSCQSSPAIQCTFSGPVPAGDVLVMTIPVDVNASPPASVTNQATISGGGIGSASAPAVPITLSSATAPPGIAPGSFSTVLSSNQAGAHPDLTTSFAFNSTLNTGATPISPYVPVGNPKDINVSLPSGFVGNPTTLPRCTTTQLTNRGVCPPASQVGLVLLNFGSASAFGAAGLMVSVYNMVPRPGEPAMFGFYAFTVPVYIDVKVRSDGDYGIDSSLNNITQVLPLTGSTLTLWGDPTDPSHDAARFNASTGGFGGVSAGISRTPFLDNPTACSGPLTSTLSSDTWQHPGSFDTAAAPFGTMTGCDQLSFQPSFSLRPDTTQPDSPAGIDVTLKVPQSSDPDGLATPALRDATVALPQGVAVSPSAADGLQGCSDAQIALHSLVPATCPDASQIGTVTLHTPLLPDPMEGQVYLGTPNCSPCTNADAQNGNMLRGFIQVRGDGVIVKLPGSFSADPQTGQLTAHFFNNPQLPFDELDLHFKGGQRGIVSTPRTCGTFTTAADFSPWSGPFTADVTPSDSFQIAGCGDPNQFAPSFQAGTMDPEAGAFSPFVLSFSRSAADQEISSLSLTLPSGMLAKIAGVPLCSDAAANAGTCPAGSQVGTVEVGSGPGSNPLFLPGMVYLTGPYKGGPYGLAVVVHAIAGPFNLGTVVVREALLIDPTDAHVTVKSDPFPTILDGIPLQVRRVDVNLNRPSFTLNPTSCNVMSVSGTLTSTQNTSADVSSRFQVGDCQGLGFSPKLKLALTGKGRTRSGDHPTLTATLSQGSGQANLHSARVTLPLSLALDPNNSQHVCDYDVAQAVHGGAVGCPASTIVGSATAVTPLLDRPLTAPVYLVQGIRFNSRGQRIRTLPSLLVPLRGQINLDLRAQSSVDGASRLVTTFPTIPDAAVSKFTLQITGGPRGLLVITGRGQSICTKAQIANANFGAQAGKTNSQNDTMGTPCSKPARLSVFSHQVNRHALILGARTSEPGRVAVTGQGLQGFSRLLAAGGHRLRVALKRGAHAAAVTVRVTLTPANGQGATDMFRMRE